MKKLVLLAVCAATISGCAVRPRMDHNDLNYYKIDCANKEAQLRFLSSQLSTKDERLASLVGVSAVTRVFSANDAVDHDVRERIRDRSTDAIVRSIMWDIRTYCP